MDPIAEAIERTKKLVSLINLVCGCHDYARGHVAEGEEWDCDDHGFTEVGTTIHTWVV